jgi:hypothetical protein
MSLKVERRAQSQSPRFGGAPIQGPFDDVGRQRADVRRHQEVAEIAVGVEVARWPALDRGMIGVDGVGDDGRCRIRRCRGRGQDGHRIGNAQRE